MRNHNIYHVFLGRSPPDPGLAAIENEAGPDYSYEDLDRRSARHASFLTQLGAEKGDRIACQVDKSPEALCLYLACLRAGLIHLPLNTAYTPDEIRYFLHNARPAVMVCRPQDEQTVRALATEAGVDHVLTLDATGSGGSLVTGSAGTQEEFGVTPVERGDVAVIIYTSGTTGAPKGAMITHGNLIANGEALRQAWDFSADDVLLHALPLFHVHGLFVATHCVLLSGARMIFLDRFDAGDVIRLLPRASVFMGVPTYYTRLLDEPALDRGACRSMRLFTSGSAPLLEQTFEAFRQRTGHTILERYGMTETGMNTSNPLHGPRIPGTVGPPLPGVSVRVVDAGGRPVPPADVGELQIRGDNVFAGYWGMPEKTAEEFTADGWFRTGDLARIDASGYVSIVGRNKDMVISGGYNVYPREVEQLIDDLDGVAESAVIGLPHPDFGEAVTAMVVHKKGVANPDEHAIITTLKRSLANYKVPKRVLFVDELPRNTMGKVQKNLLRERYHKLYDRI